jgi:hypothetical protein
VPSLRNIDTIEQNISTPSCYKSDWQFLPRHKADLNLMFCPYRPTNSLSSPELRELAENDGLHEVPEETLAIAFTMTLEVLVVLRPR